MVAKRKRGDVEAEPVRVSCSGLSEAISRAVRESIDGEVEKRGRSLPSTSEIEGLFNRQYRCLAKISMIEGSGFWLSLLRIMILRRADRYEDQAWEAIEAKYPMTKKGDWYYDTVKSEIVEVLP
ncbi:MAG TPA: hypothetical protein PKM65_20320 [Spirochaetota bacterium]|nr:hypothetical protein [Spirochaetota bacterium]